MFLAPTAITKHESDSKLIFQTDFMSLSRLTEPVIAFPILRYTHTLCGSNQHIRVASEEAGAMRSNNNRSIVAHAYTQSIA